MKKKLILPDLMYSIESGNKLGKLSIREKDNDLLFPHGSPITHKKTGNKYFYLDVLTNATNNSDGQIMVLYCDELKNKFVREISEFCEKFSADLSEMEY